jgi:MoaA/NifB/PqqE/SkfB family radical SAM enzyme
MKNNFSTSNKVYDDLVKFAVKASKEKNILPSRYVFVLTNLCNLKCSFCFQERKKRADRMETDDWLKLLNQIPDNSRITMTGGEPLVYKGFEKIFRKANQKNTTNIVTNGVLLNSDNINVFLKEKNFKILGISIDEIGGANRDFKKNQWNDLVKNINIFIKKRNNINHLCSLDIKSVVLEENIDNLFELHRYACEELKCDTHSLQLLKGAEIQHSDIMFDFKDIDKNYTAYKYQNIENLLLQLEKIRKYNLANNKQTFLHPNFLSLNSEIEIDISNLNILNEKKHVAKNFAKCLSPWASVHINVDGNLFPCMAVAMGNVKKENLDDIIFSDKFKNFKNIIEEKGTINGCNRCGWLKPKI